MNTLSIPVVAMASISFYVGSYHLLIYLKRRQNREDLTFALLCFAIVLYDVFCMGLYDATSVAEGIRWQRGQFIALAFFVPAFLWFVSDYTRRKPHIAIYLFSGFYFIAFLVQLLDRSSLTFPLDQPAIKHITLPYTQPITYYESILGPFTTVESLMGMVASTYILILAIQYYRRGHKREALPLILAIVFMYSAGLHDTFVSNGAYDFIYLIEYAYLAVILLMTQSLSNTVVEAAMAKEELRKSEERFRALVETTSDWVWEVDANGVYTYASPKVRDLLGYEPQEVLGHTPFDLMPVEEAKQVSAFVRDTMARKQPLISVENTVRSKDGRLIILDTSGVPFFDEYGRFSGYRGIDRDITERKYAEQALQAKTEELDRYFTSSLDLLCIADTDGYFRRLNPEWESTLGYSISELEGRRFIEFVHPEDVEATRAATVRLANQEQITNFENRYRCKDGSYRWIEWRSYPVDKMIYAVARDITRRRRVEEALRESEQKFRSFVEQSSDGLVLTDEQGLILEWNQAQEHLTGFARQESLGRPLWEVVLGLLPLRRKTSVISEEMKQMTLSALQSGAAEFLNKPMEVELLRFDGTKLFIQQIAFAIKTKQGHRLGVVSRDITQLKQAGEDLKRSEERYRLLVEISPIATWISKDQTITYVNPAALQLFGATNPSQIVGKKVFELIHPDYHAVVKERMAKTVREGKTVPLLEEKYLRLDGDVVDVEVIATPFTTPEGTLVQIFCQDITKRKQAEEASRTHMIQIQTIINGAPIVLYSFDTNGVFTFSDGQALAGMGLQPGEVVGKSAFEVYRDRPDILGFIRRAMSGESFTIQTCIAGRTYNISHTPLLSEQGQSLGTIGVIVDITESKQAEDALRKSETRYRALVESQVDLVSRYLPDTTLTFVNDAYCRFYGKMHAELIGQSYLFMFAPEFRERIARETKNLAEEKGTATGEYINYRYDGKECWIQWVVKCIADESGRVIELQSVGRDITQLKEAQAERERLIAELESKNAELERFTYTVSHDLKAPLITIRGFLGFIEQDAQSGNINRMKADIERISAATSKMQRLLDELLELSRIGRLMNQPTRIALGDLVQEALKLLEGRLRERNVEVKIQENLPVVFGDPPRLLEVIQNLLDNAVKFSGKQANPVIEIGTQGEEQGLPVFYVRDHGIGIVREYHERVFGLFNKLNPNAEGTGVGLAIVKRIIEVHGGRIWVESEEGQGATFYFTLGKGAQASNP